MRKKAPTNSSQTATRHHDMSAAHPAFYSAQGDGEHTRECSIKTADDLSCPYCGNEEEMERIFTCPRCGREGCWKCMPAGRGCICPECEEQEDLPRM